MAPSIARNRPASHGMATNDQHLKDDFFQSKVKDEKESVSVMKKLTAISISTVLYHRNMFPESDYGLRTHRGQTFYIMDKKAQTPEARQVVALVQSLFKPIDQKYLKSIVIGFCENPDTPNELVEAYFLNYNYSAGEVSMERTAKGKGSSSVVSSVGDEDIGHSAEKTFAKLIELCKSQDSLEGRTVYLTLTLQYTAETPGEYEPEGFVPGTSAEFTSSSDADIKSYRCGPVTTPFHSFKIKANLPKK